MKNLLGVVVLGLFLITPSQADDIREFKIEGMSLGDSLSDYFSEEEIKAAHVPGVYDDKDYLVSVFSMQSLIYDFVTVTYKPKDNKYKIYGMSGVLDFPNNIEDCYKKQVEIVKSVSKKFEKIKKKEWGILVSDEVDKSTYKPVTFVDRYDNGLNIACYHYPGNPENDNLKTAIDGKEFKKYITSTAVEATNN